jgi:hypothetical protein
MLLFIKELMGRGDKPTTSTLKYQILRLKPPHKPEEMQEVEALYYKKVNAPVSKFFDALGPRVRKVREFIKDADEVVDQEVREVATKEIVERLRKTSSDFGFDLDRISRRTGDLLGRFADILSEESPKKTIAPEYQAGIRKKTSHRNVSTKAQLIIIQRNDVLQFLGGSELDDHFADISPELLYDTLRRYLLTKAATRKNNKQAS